MPEYPDITIYIEALEQRILNSKLKSVTLKNPFLLRTVTPALSSFVDEKVVAITRMGKRIVIRFQPVPQSDNQPSRWMVFHLMIAGRLHWKEDPQKVPVKSSLITLNFDSGSLYLTEAGSKRRAALHLFDTVEALHEIDPGGLEVFESDFETFCQAIVSSNHTIKRTLTDPHIVSGIGNAYSDEILHQAKLSPIIMTQKLTRQQLKSLHEATLSTLLSWTERLRQQSANSFPERVTAFHEDMAAHGRYNKPCPVCQSPIQRIRYSTNETNYCPTCQTEGRVLADRSLSRLLKKDWPRTVEELEKTKKK